jgi:hypothetical protein
MSGYLVEVTRGRKVLYRTPSAFRDAMRSGEITGDSRILHRSTSTWISITQHPEYRRFLVGEPPAWVEPASQKPDDPSWANSEGGAPSRPAGLYRRISRGWSTLRRRLKLTKAKSPQPTQGVPPQKAVSSKPPSPPFPPAEAPSPTPSHSRWTYYP